MLPGTLVTPEWKNFFRQKLAKLSSNHSIGGTHGWRTRNKFVANRYKKGGKGSLVKCYKERIVEDFTEGQLQCPGCGQEFARDTMVHGKPAFKMIGGKVYQKK